MPVTLTCRACIRRLYIDSCRDLQVIEKRSLAVCADNCPGSITNQLGSLGALSTQHFDRLGPLKIGTNRDPAGHV